MLTASYLIASLKHTNRNHEHVIWWGKDRCGYTPVLGDYVGQYSLEDAADLNNGLEHIAVPVAVVQAIASAEPYYGESPGKRFYDQRGPVVLNTRVMWDLLIAARLSNPRAKAVKRCPTFRGKFRSYPQPTELEEAADAPT